ncbi:MAG TPA: 3-dehydroquinate synthase II [Thermoplasmata archaeon]|nr:3-dehydroquinate synthase II [Thermoplasmata archaeon]
MSVRRVVIALPPGPEAAELVSIGVHLGFRQFLVPPDRTRLIPAAGLAVIDRGEVVESPAPELRTLRRVHISDRASLAEAQERLRTGESILARFEGDRVLPLETLVSVRPAGARIWVEVGNVGELPAALGALEHGAEAAVIAVSTGEALQQVADVLGPADAPPVQWGIGSVRDVRPVGVSDRVLVDTIALLGNDEGLLVGSSAGALALVLSEAPGSKLTRPRPFRVNAGSPHSYTLLATGETRYLSELEAGDPVLVTGGGTASRPERVGRLKLERRPMVLVEFETATGRSTVFLQEAETVRLATEVGATAVTELRTGDRLRVALLPTARHLGVTVGEHIEER